MKQKEHWLLHQQRESSSVFLYSRNPSPEALFSSTVRLKIVFRKFVEMSQARVFTLLGESNVRSYITKTSVRANPLMKSAQVLPCGNLSIFGDMLSKVRPESNMCIVACVSCFLTKAGGPDVVSQRVSPIFSEIRELLDQACADHPDRFYLLSPPMYRTAPVWYREGLPEILTTFSQMMLDDKPANLLLLSSFPTPVFGEDGIHLTPYSGLEYMMHLFDNSEEAVSSLDSSVEANQLKSSESTRVLEDRVTAIEQDHRRLNRVVENKIAIDAEAADFLINERMEDFFVLVGLKKISSDLVGKAWQDQAMKDVKWFVKLLMGKSMEVVYVKNATARHKNAEVTYNVQMRHVADSSAIRTKFGGYFVGGDHRPQNMKPYSVRNRVTPETKVRLSIVQVIARRYKTSNPEAKVKVIGYDPRPLLKITPSSDVADRRTREYNFIDAVKAFPTNFSKDDLDFILKKVNPKLCGQLRSLFIVLSDDFFKKRLLRQKKDSPANAGQEEMEEMEVASEDESVPDPPQAPAVASSGKASNSRSRSQKRGASSSPSDVSASKK